MKDDSGSYAVFTEKGSSASQMTVAKEMDGQRDGPQGMSITGGGGPARVPKLHLCTPFMCGVAHTGGEGRETRPAV